MTKNSISKTSTTNSSSQFLRGAGVEKFEVNPDGDSVEGSLDIKDILVEPGQEDEVEKERISQERAQAVRKTSDIEAKTNDRATNPYYTAGHHIKKNAEKLEEFANSVYDSIYGETSIEEENKKKADEIMRTALLEVDEKINRNPNLEDLYKLYKRREFLNDELGNHEEATQDFQNIVRIRPEALNERREKVKKDYQEGNSSFEESLLGLDRIIAVDTKLPFVHQDKATILRAMGNNEAAAQEYALEVSYNPSYFNSPYGFGREHYFIKKPIFNLYTEIAEEEDSLFWYDELFKLDPASIDLRRKILDKYYKLNRPELEDLLAKYEKRIEEDPKLPWLHYTKATLLRVMGNNEAAAQEYALEVSNNPRYTKEYDTIKRNSYSINEKLVNLYEEIVEQEDSFFWYDELLKIDPENLEFRRRMAKKYYELGKSESYSIYYAEALSQYEKVIALDPKFSWVHRDKANLLRAMGDHEGAAVEYALEVAHNSYYNQDSIFQKITISELYKEIAEEENSLFWYDELIKNSPSPDYAIYKRKQLFLKIVETHNESAQSAFNQGNFEDALAQYNKIIELDPKTLWVHQNKAKVYRAIGNDEAAADEYALEVSYNPYYNRDSEQTHYYHGNKNYLIAENVRNLYETIAEEERGSVFWYNEVLKRDPNNWEARRRMADIYSDLGEPDKALSLYNEAIEEGYHTDPDLCYSNKFRINYQFGRYKDALGDMLNRAKYHPNIILGGSMGVLVLAIGSAIIMEYSRRRGNNIEADLQDMQNPRRRGNNNGVPAELQDFATRLSAVLKEYHESNPDADKILFITPLLKEVLTEELNQRGGILNILKDVTPVLEIWENHLHHLRISNEVASLNIDGCVNQPITIWNEISALASIENAPTILGKMEGLKHLFVLELIKDYVGEKFNGRNLEVEAENVLLREVHKIINNAGEIQTQWLGVPTQIAYADTVRSWATPQRINYFHQYIKEKVLDKTPFELVEKLPQSGYCDVFADIAFPQELSDLERNYQSQKGELLEIYEKNIEEHPENIDSLSEDFDQTSASNAIEHSQRRTKLISDLIIENITRELLESEVVEIFDTRNNNVLTISDVDMIKENLRSISGYLDIRHKELAEYQSEEKENSISPASSVINPSSEESRAANIRRPTTSGLQTGQEGRQG